MLIGYWVRAHLGISLTAYNYYYVMSYCTNLSLPLLEAIVLNEKLDAHN